MFESRSGDALKEGVRLLHPVKISIKLLQQVVFKKRKTGRVLSGM
jgi:hypothetical protein